MRRAAVLLLFVASSFLPSWLAAGGHAARGFAGPDGRFAAQGEIDPDGGEGSASAFSVSVDTVHGELLADLGGRVEPGSLHVTVSWSGRWTDARGKVWEEPGGTLVDEATRLTIDESGGRVSGASAALTMAQGPARHGGACGGGREARAVHRIRYRRGGRDYTLAIEVRHTRRNHRIVTIDGGGGS